MTILITGAKGRLGSLLMTRLRPQHQVVGIDIDELDVTQMGLVAQFVGDHRPDLVIHAAALTNVDYCAQHPPEALRVNGYGTKNMALACQRINAAMCYISTNEVFDGRNTAEVLEYDPTGPINPYGYSKWVGEQAIRDHLTRFYIVRTSWLFAHGGRNFIQAIIERAKSGQPMRVVTNEVATPTYTNDLAEGLLQLIATHHFGIYHLVNEGRASRWAFARAILDAIGMAETPIEKIALAEYPRPSTPPEYSVLKNSAAAQLGITLRPWQEALHSFLGHEGLLPQ
jgi:dTDP-4-dehydrorhamnose reductase